MLPVSWATHAAALAAVRRRVFIEEQRVPEDLEWDGLDATAIHVLALADDQPVGCARLLPQGKIGRMAVLAAWRRRGIGTALLGKLLEIARSRQLPQVSLSAQVTAIALYQRAGFTLCSDTYLDAGIPHRDMQRAL